jgi:predicted type IV restriction endonuclease
VHFFIAEETMELPNEIADLIERFDRNIESYLSGQYNETQLRREFLDPFFIALGWDVVNKQGYAEAYKDVIHEDTLKIGGATKAPDYCFRIGGVKKFFVEEKNRRSERQAVFITPQSTSLITSSRIPWGSSWEIIPTITPPRSSP